MAVCLTHTVSLPGTPHCCPIKLAAINKEMPTSKACLWREFLSDSAANLFRDVLPCINTLAFIACKLCRMSKSFIYIFCEQLKICKIRKITHSWLNYVQNQVTRPCFRNQVLHFTCMSELQHYTVIIT